MRLGVPFYIKLVQSCVIFDVVLIVMVMIMALMMIVHDIYFGKFGDILSNQVLSLKKTKWSRTTASGQTFPSSNMEA